MLFQTNIQTVPTPKTAIWIPYGESGGDGGGGGGGVVALNWTW